MYDISSRIDDPISNIPLKVQIQRYRCLKLDILGFMFRNWLIKNEFCQAITLELIPLTNYIKFQVGLRFHLAIFPLKSKFKDTDV